ncbi:MAG TPA: hypothetical protein VJ767_11120 [Nitrososphaeraceae archaeon]|nr:hypothetical protein [Nitrososphaeraceae archaeon]
MKVIERNSSAYDDFSIHELELAAITKKFKILESSFSPARDERINFIEIAQGLKDLLFESGFTIESLLNTRPIRIAEILGIDESVVLLMQLEAKKIL